MLTIIALVIALLFLSSPWNVVIVIVAATIDIAETGTFFWWSRRRRRLTPVAVGAETIVGRTGIALGRLDPAAASPAGQVRVEGEIWAARSAEPIDPGAPVVVSAVHGLVLDVEPDRRPVTAW
jgi:membrane protein implicated in regulation of membrane protease activity